MIHLSLLLVGFALGVFAVGILVVLILAHRPRVEAPVLRRRKNRDRVPEVVPGTPTEVGGISYQWLGVTGSEQE